MRKIFVALALIAASINIQAGGYCKEKITSLILDSSRVIFKSSKTCDGWCEISSNWSEDAVNRAYSMLLAAKTRDIEIQFYWSQLETDCGAKLPSTSSPTYIYY